MKLSDMFRPDVIGVFVGVLGIILGFIFYIRGKERALPSYAVMRRVLINPSEPHLPDRVEIRYDGRTVPALSKAIIFFWNRGTKTLSGDDIASSDPIKFSVDSEKAEILEIRSVKVTREVLNVSAALSEHLINLSFEFLDRGDGVAMEVLYAGGEDTRIECTGTVKGVRRGIEPPRYHHPKR